MDLQKAKKLLDKINSLYSGMENDADGSIATIEKDLMRSYVRQFYEVFLDNSAPVAAPKKAKRKIEVIKATPKPTPPPPPPAPKKEKPRVIELSEEVQEFISETPAPPPVPKPAPRISTPPPAPVYVPPTPVQAPAPTFQVSGNEEVLELFEVKRATDLSEKLSSSPLSDLLKAMGLNERILTVNELFGGDAGEFKKVMKDLNKLASFDEAKQYLAANVVEKYGWTKPNKKSKAKILIKTIRRRYA